MAPVLSRSLATASLASLPTSSPFTHRNNRGDLTLRNAFLPPTSFTRNGFSSAGLKWKVERRINKMVVLCDAAVAEKEEATDAPGEKFEYQAEVSRLLDLIVHSLYSHKEVFLRELVSNASDALDKLRFLSVTEPSLLGDAGELEIRIKPDPDDGTITITDTGIGMTKEELIDCLGTIAQSGTSKFLKALKENKDLGADNGLIGQFGVGFYSAFLVAERVVVSTKSPRSDKQYVWESVADSSSYTIREETDPEKQLRRGTQITLYLRGDDKYEFSEPTRIQNLVKNYSQFVSFPIYTWQEKSQTVEVEEEEPKEGEEPKPEGEKKKVKKTKTEKYWDWELANETKPLWMRNPKDLQKDEYQEFYKKAFNEFVEPLAYTHFTTEGEVEFRSILYVPGMGPLNNEEVINPKTKNIRLYVKRVFISDDFDGELFPRYLSFVKGVVDSNDLPLNVSRELLQESRIVRIMRKRLVRKTFDMIQDLAEGENKEDYKKFWENFGRFLKLGCVEDSGNHKRITPLLRFHTSKSEEELKSLDDYIENMGEDQKAIYYLATDSLKSAKTAPFLEKLVQKDIEVLYLIEPIDEVAIQNLQTYKEKKFVDISKEDLELGDEDEVKERETKQEYNLLCDWMKQQLGDKVAKVQVSKRLSSSPCVLVSGKFGWSANMERLMKAQTLGDTASLEFMRGRRILEVNHAGGGRGRGSPLTNTGHTDFSGRAPGKPDCDESKSDSPESPVPPGSGPSGLGHGRGKPLPPPSSGRSSFSSFLSSLKPQSAGRGQTTSPQVSQPTNDSGPKKPMFFKRDDSSSPTVETRPNSSSIGDREVNNKLLGNMAGVLSGLGRGKPMKQPDPENQVSEENRHLRARPTLDTTASKTVPKSQPAMNREDAVMHARNILSQGGATGRGRGEFAGRPGQGRGQGRGRDGRERFTWRDRGEKDGRGKRVDDTSAKGIYFEDPDDSGEKLAEKVGPEVMNQLVEGFEELADRVLPSPYYDEYLEALDINCAIEFEPEYLMGEFDRNPDIDEKPPIPLRDALEKVKPFLMAYEGIQSQQEWEEIMEETMAKVPLLKKIVDHYSGPDRVTAKVQQEELERVAKTLPQNAPSSVKRFADRAVLSLQSNPGWGFDKKCQFMDKLVWEVSQHYK